MFIKLKTLSGKEINLNTDLIESFDNIHDIVEVHMVSSRIIQLSVSVGKELHDIIYPVKKTTKNHEPKDELAELFTRLHKLTQGKGVAVFTPKREKQLADLLSKHRLTEELLIKAATNIGQDPFLQGENDSKKRYGDVDYLLRPEKAAKWSEDQLQKKKPGLF